MDKKGFTILEILVALTILVVVFTLITLLYVRAARTRNIINAYNEVGEVLSQMIDIITNGRKGVLGLKDAGNICSQVNPPVSLDKYTLVFSDSTAKNTVIYQIKIKDTDRGETSLYQNDVDLDLNKKVYLLSGSRFEYYDANGRNIIDEKLNTETTLVRIILIGKATHPAMKKMVPMRIETSVRLKNKLSF
ncbi:MAG: type II secretion system GspH family protein [Candidatus Omnitrophica bacterium]|nr:type II secretion system GspH family protein [Candidatus Omnitrophota bacterium]MCM8807284.1 type II secretion system GspH family protein [Candidatus Omnitrophota bacterium]